MDEEKRLEESRDYWDAAAPTFDAAPDHGLGDPIALQHWTELLSTWFPAQHFSILDIGCGTGSLSIVLAGLGHTVTGVDLSPAMISIAKAKAQAKGAQIAFQVMDAAFPQFNAHLFDGLICRHLLWALPEPDQVLQRWVQLLKPGGHLVLVEGYWGTGVGLHADEIINILPDSVGKVSVQDLSENENLWGKPVADERYVIVGEIVE